MRGQAGGRNGASKRVSTPDNDATRTHSHKETLTQGTGGREGLRAPIDFFSDSVKTVLVPCKPSSLLHHHHHSPASRKQPLSLIPVITGNPFLYATIFAWPFPAKADAGYKRRQNLALYVCQSRKKMPRRPFYCHEKTFTWASSVCPCACPATPARPAGRPWPPPCTRSAACRRAASRRTAA